MAWIDRFVVWLRSLIYTRLWFGLPFVAIVSFVIVFLIAHFGGQTPDKSLSEAFVAAAIVAIVWVGGIVHSTLEDDKEEEKLKEVERELPLVRAVRITFGVICGLALLALYFGEDVKEWIAGEESAIQSIVDIVRMVLAIGAALVCCVWNLRLKQR